MYKIGGNKSESLLLLDGSFEWEVKRLVLHLLHKKVLWERQSLVEMQQWTRHLKGSNPFRMLKGEGRGISCKWYKFDEDCTLQSDKHQVLAILILNPIPNLINLVVASCT